LYSKVEYPFNNKAKSAKKKKHYNKKKIFKMMPRTGKSSKAESILGRRPSGMVETREKKTN
jgi:hypothetical protein